MRAAGLFAGIGGIERGFEGAGIHSVELCEIECHARAVLNAQFHGIPVFDDVRTVDVLPECQVLAAGFPCQDLSQAGPKVGITGGRSGLVGELFRLLRSGVDSPTWLVLENVSYMLHLGRGAAMEFLTESLESLGYTWAYRVVDARSFGIPQRRLRVILVASKTEDPRTVLFADDSAELTGRDIIGAVDPAKAYGFYWTEGLRGLGWAEEAIPTLKAGSTIGIASPPAIWFPDSGLIGKPDIRDAERLQGFPEGWTEPALMVPKSREGVRWKLLGNAVCVPVAEWVGRRLSCPGDSVLSYRELTGRWSWPKAAWGSGGRVFTVNASTYPEKHSPPELRSFLRYPLQPLSAKAASGFLSRARSSKLNFPEGLLGAVEAHIDQVA